MPMVTRVKTLKIFGRDVHLIGLRRYVLRVVLVSNFIGYHLTFVRDFNPAKNGAVVLYLYKRGTSLRVK